MMKSMRDTIPAEDLLGGKGMGGEMFQEMLDSQFVDQAKGNLRLGLAGALYRELVEMQGSVKSEEPKEA
jgi:Rod binding domain-containing protein